MNLRTLMENALIAQQEACELISASEQAFARASALNERIEAAIGSEFLTGLAVWEIVGVGDRVRSYRFLRLSTRVTKIDAHIDIDAIADTPTAEDPEVAS